MQDADREQPAEQQPDLGARARVGVRWQGLAQIIDVGLGIGVLLLLARLVAPSDFGLVALAVAVTGIITALLNSPITGAVVALKLTEQRELSTAWWMSLASSGILALLLSLGTVVVGLSPAAILAIAGVALSVPLAAGANVMTSILQQRLHFRALARVRIAATLAAAVVPVTLALLGAHLEALVLRQIIPPVVMVLLGATAARWRPSFGLDRGLVRRIVAYGRGVAGFNFLNTLMRRGDDMLVGAFLGSVSLGLYSLSYRFIETPVGQLGQMAINVAFPTLSHIADPAAFRSAFLRAQKLGVWLVAPVGVCSMCLGDLAVVDFLGEQWRNAGPVIQIFGPIALLQAAGTQVGVIYMARQATGLLFRWALFATPIVLMGVVVGIQWGIVGVAWAYLVVNLLVAYPTWSIPGKLIGLRPVDVVRNLKVEVGMGVALATAVLGARQAFSPAGAVQTGAALMGVALAYWGIALALDRALRRDLTAVVRERSRPAERAPAAAG